MTEANIEAPVLSERMANLLAAVDGQIIAEEGLLLFDLAAAVPAEQIVVEIGSYKGKSSCYLASGAMSGNGALVYCVDLWRSAPWPAYATPEVRQAWDDNMGFLGLFGHAIAIERDTAQAEKEIGGEVGLLFVDSDHSYEGVCRDIATWQPRMAAGGTMVFHDARSEVWGVKRALDDTVLGQGEYQAEIRHGLAIVRRRVQ